ncbi:hypothetical protein V8C26DRAFT_69928 [Trichoderma gracile]
MPRGPDPGFLLSYHCLPLLTDNRMPPGRENRPKGRQILAPTAALTRLRLTPIIRHNNGCACEAVHIRVYWWRPTYSFMSAPGPVMSLVPCNCASNSRVHASGKSRRRGKNSRSKEPTADPQLTSSLVLSLPEGGVVAGEPVSRQEYYLSTEIRASTLPIRRHRNNQHVCLDRSTVVRALWLHHHGDSPQAGLWLL